MKFKLSEHMSIFLFLLSLVILGISIFIGYYYEWKIVAIAPIAIAGVACIVLLAATVYDYYSFFKKKREVDTKIAEMKEKNEKAHRDEQYK